MKSLHVCKPYKDRADCLHKLIVVAILSLFCDYFNKMYEISLKYMCMLQHFDVGLLFACTFYKRDCQNGNLVKIGIVGVVCD